MLELPAGLIDPEDESLEASCSRELKEETGYTGKPLEGVASPIVFRDPWKNSAGGQGMLYEVDLELEENQNPK